MESKQNKMVDKVTETVNGNLILTREPITNANGEQMKTADGRLYFAYVTRGVVRTPAGIKEVKVDFCPKDQGGYEPLDLLFEFSPKAELVMTEETMTDNNGRTSHYTVYTAQVVDADGQIWPVSVKPQRDSDKTLLRFLLNTLDKANANKVA